jgi:hypothetical protein
VISGSLEVVCKPNRHLVQMAIVEALQSHSDLPVQQPLFCPAETPVYILLEEGMPKAVAG